MDEGGVIYLIWNLVNGKRYVGQTTQPLNVRMAQHLRGDIVVDKAIQKYGIENFRYGVIKTCYSKEELDYWERYYIAVLKSKAPCGYNMTDGGEGTIGYKFTPAQCANVSAARKGKKLSPEHRANIGAKVRGENNGFFGKHHTDESRAIMAEIHRIEMPYKNLLNELNKRKMLYTDLVGLLGIAISTLSQKIHGKFNFTARDAEKLEKIFGLPIEYLLQRDDGSEATLSNRGISPYKNLIAEMELRNMSYTVLAKLMGLGVVSVSNKMRGKTRFTKKDKKRLAEIFGKSAEYLLQRFE